MSCLDKVQVLSLNANWAPVKEVSVRKAIENMTSNRNGQAPELGLDISFGTKPDGTVDYDNVTSVRSVGWDEWIKLPIRPYDEVISTGRFKIRAPTVIICTRHSKTLFKEPKLSKRAILERDGYRCQYTNEVLPASQLNVDHVIPRSKGGKDRWENLVASKKKLNSDKGNRFNHEMKLKLLRQPAKPKPVPVCFTIQKIKHPSWQRFLTK